MKYIIKKGKGKTSCAFRKTDLLNSTSVEPVGILYIPENQWVLVVNLLISNFSEFFVAYPSNQMI